ncbi:1,4-alpha-glucan branching protein GlgB [Roseospirillum parvum]|uniref:1,4-alpha-glucan branching enzyme GlgB n=1 Tax=Roseospirillum parvum TaxID=83401 RepID=A0A1G7WY78_9PROT|nr:1,4-alpha-glucan branching protein GlgB [Roseospirillum parvum]SDG76892.1 1,4-alpha-glucan branching enzyme [Roseospirillum parvum]
MPRKLVDKATETAIVTADAHDPFTLLGLHRRGDGVLVIRVFDPRAEALTLLDAADDSPLVALAKVHPDGLFAAEVPGREAWFPYRLARTVGGETAVVEDPYRFPPWLGETDVYLIAEGTHQRPYERLGAHPTVYEGVPGVAFAVWAPNARRVSVVGDFNDWDGRVHMMRSRGGAGLWELFIPHLVAGALYKFEIRAADGSLLPLKFDPYGFYGEKRPANAAIVHGLTDFPWTDEGWIRAREAAAGGLDRPMSIYEVHLGSWARVPEDEHRFLSYDELGDRLVPYVRDLGFTHIELLPIHEHPFDGSWGYQPVGLYAPTSRFGDPSAFKRFIDRCHNAGIGVIIDWVPGHFPTDAHALGLFDGTHLYEHADPRKGRHMDWDTLIYNFGRIEVRNFLIANALYWIEQFHIDGLRVDAVASMLYLDYSRQDGEWIPNQHGGNENLEAIDFLKRLNELVYELGRGAMTIAEESTAWPMVSRPTYLGGLGFGYKWNMGWMHDTLEYFKKDPIHRRWHQNQLTFGLLYAFNENFILPLSHDEVVHGKGSLFGRMAGDRWQKFANLRAYYGFMWAHPGKQLLFMGGELGQEREWDEDQSLDWHLLEDPLNRGVKDLVGELNRLYVATPALYQQDFDPRGFEWIDGSDADNSVLSWIRWPRDGSAPIVCVANLTPQVLQGYRVGVPWPGAYHERLNTDDSRFGGSGVGNGPLVDSEPVEGHGRPHSLLLTLPPLATVWLQPVNP